MYFPRIEIISEELGLGACDIEDIPEYLEQTMPREQITVLYWYERDWLILNKGNINYNRYKAILTEYLQMNDRQRKRLKDFAETMNITFFAFVNQALRIRRNRYQAKLKKTA